jgi:hypothetical protein
MTLCLIAIIGLTVHASINSIVAFRMNRKINTKVKVKEEVAA